MSIIKFKIDEPVKVRLDFDSGQRVDGDYGTQFKYGCNGGEDLFYATPTLATLIDQITGGQGKNMEITIMKKYKTDANGKEIPIFTVDGKSMDDLSQVVRPISDSPVGAGFAHKDTKAGLTLSALDYRISLLEDAVAGLEENQHHHPRMDADSEKDGRKAEAELPF
jgi:hypothetical protein